MVQKVLDILRPEDLIKNNDKVDVEHQNGANKKENDDTPIEEAVRLTGYGRFNHGLMLGCGFATMGAIMEMIVVGYLISSAQCDFEMSDQDKGVLGAVTYIGIFCSGHFWGIMADTQGRKKVMQISLILDAIIGLLSTLSPNYTTLVVFRFLNGFCISAPASVSYTYLGEFNTPENRNRNLILLGLFTGSCAVSLPAFGWLVIPQSWELLSPWGPLRSWRLLTAFAAVPSLLSGLSLFFLPESPKFLLACGQREEALKILSNMYATNTGKAIDTYPVKSLKEETTAFSAAKKKTATVILRIVWNQTAPLFRPPFLLHTVLVCFMQFGNIASASGLLMWLPELFNLQTKYGEAHNGEGATFCYAAQFVGNYSTAPDSPDEPVACNSEMKQQVFINALILGVVNMFLPLFGGLVVNVLGKKNLLIVCMAITGVSAVAMNFAASYVVSLALACVVVSGTGMCISHISSIAVDLFPTNLRAMALSLSLMCGRLGAMSGNVIFGSLIKTQCEVAFYFFGGLLLLNGVVGCILPKKGKFAN